MEWTVVSVLVILVGLFFTVGKPIYSLLRDLERLRFETDAQDKEINRDVESIKELTKIAQAHENRIANQESEVDKLAGSVAEIIKLNQDHEMRLHDLEQDVSSIKSKDNGGK